MAQKACDIVGQIRADEQKTIWNKDVANDEDNVELYPGMMFMLAKSRMESTKLWRIARKMPKGTLLHAHMIAMVDLEWLFHEVLATPGMCFCSPEALTSEEACQKALVRFEFSRTSEYGGTPIWTHDYVPNTLVPAAIAADTYPDGGRSGFISWLKNRSSIIDKESVEHHLGVDSIWRKFTSVFRILASIVYYEPILRRFINKLLLTLVEDGVQWVELRDAFAAPFRREGCEIPDSDYNEMVRIIGEEIENFKSTKAGEDFWGARIIWTSLRAIPAEQIIQSKALR